MCGFKASHMWQLYRIIEGNMGPYFRKKYTIGLKFFLCKKIDNISHLHFFLIWRIECHVAGRPDGCQLHGQVGVNDQVLKTGQTSGLSQMVLKRKGNNDKNLERSFFSLGFKVIKVIAHISFATKLKIFFPSNLLMKFYCTHANSLKK